MKLAYFCLPSTQAQAHVPNTKHTRCRTRAVLLVVSVVSRGTSLRFVGKQDVGLHLIGRSIGRLVVRTRNSSSSSSTDR